MVRIHLPGCLLLMALLFAGSLLAQTPESSDSFFLAKKKGLLGRIGRSISRDGQTLDPIKNVDPFKDYKGKIIRSIEISPLGFNRNLNDTAEVRNSFPIRMANAFHKNSTQRLIKNYLFFKEGDRLLPLLFSDNERFLREQAFLQDALIIVFNANNSKDSVDVMVLTRDVFSLGGSGSLSSLDRARVEVKDENVSGSGNRLSVSALYDKKRNPKFGLGAEFIKRNIGRSFIDATVGFKTFNNALVNNRFEENRYYLLMEKPLVSRYSEWTGALELSYNENRNVYLDTMYTSIYAYAYSRADLWLGYNFGAKSRKFKDSENRLRHFVAMRSFYNNFYKVPVKFQTEYNFNYADINGVLFSYSLYKQNFYRTNFIYGFGRNEDVPEGINATVTAGYTNKQGDRRAYYGFDFDATHYSDRGYFTSYTLRAGGFSRKDRMEDVDVLAGISHFTRLREINKKWRNRNFISLYYTKQMNTLLNAPLLIQSEYGLPYFRNDSIFAATRATVKVETVFYNLKKVAGFRFAPFIFADFSFLKPVNESMKKTNGYSAIGGGVRTRNENLIFGTIELRGYFFPRTQNDMRNWKVEVSTNIKFKYNSSFIRRPDFVVAN
jgi:hypothetical protein